MWPISTDELRMQEQLQEALNSGSFFWPELGLRPLPEVLAVLRHLARLVLGGTRGAPLRRAIHYLIPDVELPKIGSGLPVVIERLNIEDRRRGLVAATRLLHLWPHNFVTLCRATRVWHSNLLSDFPSPPQWYSQVVESQLYLPGFVPGQSPDRAR